MCEEIERLEVDMFERFEKSGRAFKNRITIQKGYVIALNLAATEEFKIRDYKFAVFFFDREAMRVGIKLTNERSETGALKVRIREKVGALLSARSFIEYYKLGDFRSKTFDATWNARDKMVVFQLK